MSGDSIRHNRGVRTVQKLAQPRFPNAGEVLQRIAPRRGPEAVDVVLFHIAAPYPGTPFFFEVVENNWFRPGTQWEKVDMDRSTVLDYPGLPAERLEYWQRRAFREWACVQDPF